MPRNHQDTYGKIMPYTEAGAGEGVHHPAAFVICENSQIDRANKSYFYTYNIYRSAGGYDADESYLGTRAVFMQGEAFDAFRNTQTPETPELAENFLANLEWAYAMATDTFFAGVTDYPLPE